MIEEIALKWLKKNYKALPLSEFTPILKAFMEEKYKASESDTKSGATTRAAVSWGCSKMMVSHVMNQERFPTPSMLEDAGYDEHTITFYTKKKKRSRCQGT